jgi:hypothetical protein
MDDTHIDEVYARILDVCDTLNVQSDDLPIVTVLLEARDVIAYLREKADERIVIQCGDDDEPVVISGERAEQIRQAAIEQYVTKALTDMIEREQARQRYESKVNAWTEAANKPRDKWWPTFTTDVSVNNSPTYWSQ